MRRLGFCVSATLITCAMAIGAQASSAAAPEGGVAADGFAKESFKTLYTLPRSAEAKKAIPGLLHDEEAWQMFLQRNFAAPNVGLATLKDLTATYTFPSLKKDVKVRKDSVVVNIAAIQEVRVFGRLAGRNCVATTFYLDMPNGIDDSAEATIKEVLMITAPVENEVCEPIDSE